MAYDQTRDKITGEKLYPIQVWVEAEIHNMLTKLAAKEGRTLKAMLRIELNKIARRKL